MGARKLIHNSISDVSMPEVKTKHQDPQFTKTTWGRFSVSSTNFKRVFVSSKRKPSPKKAKPVSTNKTNTAAVLKEKNKSGSSAKCGWKHHFVSAMKPKSNFVASVSYVKISSNNSKNSNLKAIYIAALKSEDHEEITALLGNFLEEISKLYPTSAFNKEERDDNYKKFVDICARRDVVYIKKSQEQELGYNDTNNQSDDLDAIFRLAYQQLEPQYKLSDKHDYHGQNFLQTFLPSYATKIEFVREDGLSIIPNDELSLDSMIERLELIKQDIIKNASGGITDRVKQIIDMKDAEITRLQAKKKVERPHLKSSNQVARDILEKELELIRPEIDKRMAFYIRGRGNDVDTIVNEVMGYIEPKIRQILGEPKNKQILDNPDTKKDLEESSLGKIEVKLKIFREIITNSVERQLNR